jgi:hypothetical protein
MSQNPPEAFVSGLSGGTMWNIVWDQVGAAALFALPADNDVGLQPGPPWNTRHTFILPQRCAVHAVHVKGDPSYTTVNSVVDAGANPLPVNIDLYVNGVFEQTLLTIPAGDTDFDLYAKPNVTIEASSFIQFVVDLTNWNAGSIGNLLVNIAIVPL